MRTDESPLDPAEAFLRLLVVRPDVFGSLDVRTGVRTVQESFITTNLIRKHLDGEVSIGLYSLAPPKGDENAKEWDCKWGCIDLDVKVRDGKDNKGRPKYKVIPQRVSAVDEVGNALIEAGKNTGLFLHAERSKSSGLHIWCFASSLCKASVMRAALQAVLREVLASQLAPKLKLFGKIEVNPKQLAPPAGTGRRVGNYIDGPLHGISRGKDKRLFIDLASGQPYSDQLIHLTDILRCGRTPISALQSFEQTGCSTDSLQDAGFKKATCGRGDGDLERIWKDDSSNDRSQRDWKFALGLVRVGLEENEVADALIALPYGKASDPKHGRGYARLTARKAIEDFASTSDQNLNGVDQSNTNEIPTISLSRLLMLDLPAIRWAIPDLLPEGLTLLVGGPKLGKSFLAFDWAIGIAFGHFVLGNKQRRVEAGDVLYLGIEDGLRRLQSRARLIMKHKNLAGNGPEASRLHLFNWKSVLPKLNEGLVESLKDYLDAHPDIRLIVIDTLGRVRSSRKRGQDSYSIDTEELGALQRLAIERHVAILAVHHSNKKEDANDFINAVSGTSGIAGAADATLFLERVRGQADAVLRLTGRDVDELELALRREIVGNKECGGIIWSELGSADEYRMTHERVMIIQAFQEMAREAKTEARPHEIARHLGRPGSANSLAKLMRKMADAGELRSVKYGTYALISLVGGPTGPTDPTTPSGPSGPTSPKTRRNTRTEKSQLGFSGPSSKQQESQRDRDSEGSVGPLGPDTSEIDGGNPNDATK